MADVDVLAELADLRGRIAALEAAEAARHRGRLWRDDALLLVLAASVGVTAFSASEVLTHARVDAALAAALDAPGLSSSPRRLGKYLRARVGAMVGDRELACIGEDRAGCIWCFIVRK